jgi:hypothetical protein
LTSTDLVQTAEAIAIVIGAVASLIAARRTGQTGTKLENVHQQINSRMDQLIDATANAAGAAAVSAERADVARRAKEEKP